MAVRWVVEQGRFKECPMVPVVLITHNRVLLPASLMATSRMVMCEARSQLINKLGKLRTTARLCDSGPFSQGEVDILLAPAVPVYP